MTRKIDREWKLPEDPWASAAEFAPESGQKPMVTREEYDQARAVLANLQPGYYVKCALCSGWWLGGTFHHTINGPVCEQCQ